MIRFLIQCVILASLGVVTYLAGSQAWTAYVRYGIAPSVPVSGQSAPSGVAAIATQTLALDNKPLAAYPQTAAQPLFFEGRRYPVRPKEVVKPEVPVAVPPPTPVKVTDVSGVKLRGIIVAPGVSRAFIEIAPKAAEWLRIGDNVEGWKLQTIDQDKVALVNGLQTATIELYTPRRQ
jgi:hypothetical protein